MRSRAAVVTSPTISHRSTISTAGSARTRAYVAFQVRPAGLTDEGLCGATPQAEQMTGRGEAQLREVPDHRQTPGDHVLDQAGKEFVEDLRPSGHQQMGVPTLGDTPPILRRLQERVAFDCDSLVRVGKHPGGEKPGHAGPEDHRVVTDLRHL
jgi:hypothetical protein